MRRIRTYGTGPSPGVDDALQLAFGLEMISPSRTVWLVSPWISDIPVLDNRAGAFSTVGPGWGLREVHLVDVLDAMLDNGTEVTVVTRKNPENAYFLSRVSNLSEAWPSFRLIFDEDVHEKGFVSDHVFLTGSMNYTFAGRSSNRELLEVDESPSSISEARLELEGRYPRSEARR